MIDNPVFWFKSLTSVMILLGMDHKKDDLLQLDGSFVQVMKRLFVAVKWLIYPGYEKMTCCS